MRIFLFGLFCFLAARTFAAESAGPHRGEMTVDESAVVMRALVQNPGIRLSKNSFLTDSLGLAKANADWLPQVSASIEQEFAYEGESEAPEFSSGRSTTNPSVKATQAIPGGGEIGFSVGHEIGRGMGDTDTLNSDKTTTSLSLRQPLLKGAWDGAQPRYTIRTASLNHRIVSLEHRRKVLGSLSQARLLYWGWFRRQKSLDIAGRTREYTAKYLESERQRFRVGEIPAIDTMSAALEYLRALESEMTARAQAANAREEIAVFLAADPDSFTLDTSVDLRVNKLPPVEEFLDAAERFDPKLEIFETIARRLALEEKYRRNQMFPELDLTARYSTSTGSGATLLERGSSGSDVLVGLVLSYALPVRDRVVDRHITDIKQQNNRIEKDGYRRELKRRVRDLARQWDLEMQKTEIASVAEDVARQQLDAARKGYEIGTVDNLKLIKAQNDYNQASLNSLRAKVALKEFEVTFEEITGEVLTRFGVQW